jgi:uncharacterized RDD family membrane protein YckC
VTSYPPPGIPGDTPEPQQPFAGPPPGAYPPPPGYGYPPPGFGYPPPPPPGYGYPPPYSFGEPPAPVPGGRKAGMGPRLGGFVIDLIITTVISVLLGAFLHVLFGSALTLHFVTLTKPDGSTQTFTFSPFSSLTSWVVALVYFGCFVGLRGATPGHLVAGLRVVDVNTGQYIGFWRAMLRALVLLVTGAICTLGYWSPFFDSTRRQGWHDMSARAVVIPSRRRG